VCKMEYFSKNNIGFPHWYKKLRKVTGEQGLCGKIGDTPNNLSYGWADLRTPGINKVNKILCNDVLDVFSSIAVVK